jgi:uncharacterized cupredoxin-like copper-binding protein
LTRARPQHQAGRCALNSKGTCRCFLAHGTRTSIGYPRPNGIQPKNRSAFASRFVVSTVRASRSPRVLMGGRGQTLRRTHLSFPTVAIGFCLVIAMFAAFSSASASGQTRATRAHDATATVITVTAGKPVELGFKLSKVSEVPAGTVTFKVTNEGIAFHSFKLCTTPVTTDAKNTCTGVVTKLLKHGQSATLTVKLTKSGKYEYLCAVPGHAAAGMKGLIGVGVAVKSAPATSTTTTTSALTGGGSATTTTTTSSGGGASALPPSGPDGCPGGTSIQANLLTTGGDGDVDETGQQSDGDGCV